MTDFILLAVAIGVAVLAYKSGLEVSRKQVLDQITERIARIIGNDSEFSAKYGVRGGYLTVDYFAEGSRLGSGYNSAVDGHFVILDSKQFMRMVSRATGEDESES